MSRRILALLALLFLVVSGLMGAEHFGGMARGEDNENPALKYHAILAKRPEPGYLFDRFYNAWLDRGTVESLQEFLQSRIDGEDTTANRLLLAFFHAKQNNDVAAIDEFAKALATGRAGAEVWYHKALAESRTLDFEVAIADLKKARQENPDAKLAVRIDRQLGTMLLRNHETEAAIGVWKALLAANPSDEELCEDVIELHLEEGLFKEAAALSESLIARTKDPYLAVTRRLRLGDIYDRSGERTKAVEIYTSTLEQAGQDSWLEREILAQIEQLFRREDDLSSLKKQYTSLLAAYPKRIGLQRRRCRLLVELGDHDEAIQGYNKILELTPGDRGIREEYVGVLSRIGRHEPAVKQLEALCEQNPDDAELRVRLAKTLHAAKRPAEAMEAVRQYLKTSDQSEYAHLRAARLVESFGDKTEAATFYRALADKFADSPSAQEAHAVFLYANNQKKDALAIWRKLAQEADVKGVLNVARALGSRGEDAAAFELLSRRQKDFGDEPLFLGQLVATALRQKQFEQALPWARRRVELASSVAELEAAVAQAATACEQSDKLGPMIAELDAMDSRPIALTCLLAELLECDGRSRRADQLLSEPAASGELLAVGQQIRLFSLRREWAQAAEATRRMLELAGGHKSLHVRRLVELYEQDYQIDEALKWVETWKRLSPGATTPWLAQARLLELQGNQDAVQEALRNAVQRFDKDEDLRARLAQAYQSAGKIRDAERVYWQLYEKSGDVVDRLRWAAELAKLAEREGTIARLVENFQERHRGNRRSIVPLLALAEVHRVAGNYEGRRQSLMAATQVKPDDLQLLTHLARIDESEGNWKEAVATLERAARLDKTNQTRQKIARLHLEYGDVDQGYAMLRELMGDRTADPRALEHMADALCGMMEWDRAIELLRDRMAHHPGDYRLRFLLAVAYEESGRTDEAIAQFVELLDNQEELAQDKKKAAQSSPASHIDIIRRLVPAETMEWFEISQYQHSVYQYRQRGSRGPYMASPVGMPSTTISLPPSAAMVRPYAMVHLLMLARELDESRVTAFAAAMKNHGVRNPKLLLKLGFETNSGLPAVAEALEEDPDNESLLAMVVFSGFAREQAVDAAPLARAFAKFRRSRPELAVMAAIQAAASDEKHAPLLDEAVGLAATIENPNPLVMMSLATSLGGQPWGRGDMPSALTEKQRAKLVKLLVDWYPRMSQDATLYGPYAFICVVGAIRSSEDPSAYFNMLDDEVARWHASGGKQGGQNPFSMGRQPNASLLEPLGFPPRELTDFPPNVSMLLVSDEGNPYSHILGLAPGPVWETEKVEPLVAKVKDPTLRVLLAKQYELPKVVDATLKEMLAGRTPRLDAYLMAAGKAEADLRFGESVRLLEKARHLPMKQETRRRIDAALVAAVRSAKDNDKADEAALKAGRDAALRLRRQRLDAQQRDQLIAVLEDFGLKKEAKKLEKRTAAMGNTGGPYSSTLAVAAPSARYSKTSNSRVDKLIASGKRDAATRLLANEARSLCQQMLANSGNYQYYRRQGRELKNRLANLGMVDDVLKQFAPGESGGAARARDYALVCELLEKTKEARDAYRRMLADRPRDDLARTRLILLADDPAEIDEHLGQLGDAASSGFGQMLTGMMQDHETDFEQRFRYVEIAVRYLTRLKERPRADASWAFELVQSFGRQQYSNRARNHMPSLYPRRSEDRGLERTDGKLEKRRIGLHRDLCLAMMEVPEVARHGFRSLLAAAEARGDLAASKAEPAQPSEKKADDQDAPPRDTADDFRNHAEKVLLGEATQPILQGPYRVVHYHYSSGGSSEVRFRDPEEYLAAGAWRSGDWKRIDEVLLPKLAEGRDRQPHKALARLARLYRCEPDQFLATAKEVVKQSAPAVPHMPQTGDGLAFVVDVWADRALAVDLEPMVLENVRREARGRGYPSTSSASIMRYLETLMEQGKADQGKRNQAREVLEKITAEYLGPADKRAEFIKKNYQQHSVSWGSANGQIHSYINLLSELAQSDSLLFLVLAEAQPLGEIMQGNNVAYQVQECTQRVLRREPAEILALLESSPWLADFDEFRVLPLGQEVDEWPLARMFRDSEGLAAKRLKPLWKSLEENQKTKPTFGRGFLLAVAAQRSSQSALLDYLGKHIDGVKQLPADEQANLSVIAKGLLPPDAMNRKDASPEARAAQAWIEEHLADRSQQFLDKLRKAKRLEELGLSSGNYWEVGRYLGEILPDLARNDPKTAKEVFFRLVSMTEKAQMQGQTVQRFSDGNTLGGQILEYALQRRGSELNPEMLVFLIDVLGSSEGQQISLGNWTREVMRQTVWRSFERSRRGSKGKTLPAEQAAERFRDDLGKMLDGRPATLLIPGMSSALAQHFNSAKDFAKMADWARREADGGKYPAIAGHLYACARLAERRADRADRSKAADPLPGRHETADYHEHFHRLIADADAPMSWRLTVAAFVIDNEGAAHVPVDLARDAVALYIAAMEKAVPISDVWHRSLLEVLASLREESASGELAAQWGKQFARRYLRGTYGQTAVSTRDPSFTIHDPAALGRALALYLAAGDLERVNQLLGKYDQALRQIPSGLAQLVRFEKPDLAARLFRRHWATLEFHWSDGALDRHDEQIRSRMPAFLAKLSHDDERLLAEILLATMPDAKGKSRDDRLVALAERLKNVEFRDQARKTRAVLGLITSEKAAAVVADEVAAEYKTIDVAEICTNNDYQKIEAAGTLIQRHVANRLAAGDVKPFLETFKSLSTNSNNIDYLFDRLGSPILESCGAMIKKGDVHWTKEQSKALADALRGMMKGRNHPYFSYRDAYISMLFLTHAQAGQTEELVKWFTSLSRHMRRGLQDTNVCPEIWNVLGKTPGTPTEENRQQRADLACDTLRALTKTGWFRWDPNRRNRIRGDNLSVFHRVVKCGLMTSDELAELGPAMVDKLKDAGLAQAALAAWLHDKKEYEKAVTMWRGAIGAAPGKDSQQATYWHWDLARSLEAQGRSDEAKEALAKVNPKKIDRRHRRSFKKFRAKIEKPKTTAIDGQKNGINASSYCI